MTALDAATRVLFLHAHPDDESLSTGALIVDLVGNGIEVAVITATRGERGEVRDAVRVGPRDLPALRERELASALAVLGVRHSGLLGQPPARAPGLPPRRYTDSGMVWLTPALAGPASDSGPDALTAADPGEAAADLAAYAEWFRAEVVVSYDELGGYGHPDHVACHRIGKAAAGLAGTGWVEIVSDPAPDPSLVLPLDQHVDVVAEALRQFRSQLRIEGTDVVHVGGQRHRIPTGIALRDAPAGWHP